MVNKDALMGKIVSRGYTQASIAPLMGRSKNTLNAKINNKIPFDTDEIFKLCELLEITDDSEKVYIFLHKTSRNRDDQPA